MSTSQQGRVGTRRTEKAPARRQMITPPRTARRRVTVQRVSPWSVLKLSLIFYFCMLLVVMVASAILWSVIIRVGLLADVTDLLAEFNINVRVNGGNAARLLFLLGLIGVVFWTAFNVFLAFLYNLIADLVGGLRVTLAEEDVSS